METKYDKFVQSYLKKDLTVLDYKSKNLETFDEDLSKFYNLQHIIMSNNLLKEIPKCFKILKTVKIVNMDNNLLENIGDVFHQMDALESLSLKDNDITNFFTKKQVSLGFGKLTHLYLNNNPITFDLEALKNFKALKELHIAGVDIQKNVLKELELIAFNTFKIFY
jgi:Leucine-rich repeat (LRR) protein